MDVHTEDHSKDDILIEAAIILPPINKAVLLRQFSSSPGGNMKRRIWDSKNKARIVLEGLQGRSVATLCNECQITQSMYYRWRGTFLANAAQAFETGTTNRREERLTAEKQKFKQPLAS